MSARTTTCSGALRRNIGAGDGRSRIRFVFQAAENFVAKSMNRQPLPISHLIQRMCDAWERNKGFQVTHNLPLSSGAKAEEQLSEIQAKLETKPDTKEEDEDMMTASAAAPIVDHGDQVDGISMACSDCEDSNDDELPLQVGVPSYAASEHSAAQTDMCMSDDETPITALPIVPKEEVQEVEMRQPFEDLEVDGPELMMACGFSYRFPFIKVHKAHGCTSSSL